MTLANRRKYKNILIYSLIGLLFLLIMSRVKRKAVANAPVSPESSSRLEGWNTVENIAFGLLLLVIIGLLIIAAPLIPFIAPVFMYIAAGLLAIYALYMTVLRHGMSNSVLPDHPMHNHESADGGGSILTVLPYVRTYNTPMNV